MTNNKKFALAAVVIGAIVFAVLILFNRPADAPEPTQAQASEQEFLVRPHSPIKGPAAAPVTIVEFLDPECESCRAMHPIVKQLRSEYGDQVRVVIRYMPFHGNSLHAAAALEEARELGHYDAALDTLFEHQPIWGSHHDPKPELIATYLKEIGIDESRLKKEDLISKHKWKIDLDEADATKLGVRATPTFFVNGVKLPEIGYQPLKDAIEIALSSRASEDQ